MLWGQSQEQVAKVFQETAATYTLTVAILLGFAILVLLFVVVVLRWAKPLVEKLVGSAVSTMLALRESAASEATTLRILLVQSERTLETLEGIKSSTDEQTRAIRSLACADGSANIPPAKRPRDSEKDD